MSDGKRILEILEKLNIKVTDYILDEGYRESTIGGLYYKYTDLDMQIEGKHHNIQINHITGFDTALGTLIRHIIGERDYEREKRD